MGEVVFSLIPGLSFRMVRCHKNAPSVRPGTQLQGMPWRVGVVPPVLFKIVGRVGLRVIGAGYKTGDVDWTRPGQARINTGFVPNFPHGFAISDLSLRARSSVVKQKQTPLGVTFVAQVKNRGGIACLVVAVFCYNFEFAPAASIVATAFEHDTHIAVVATTEASSFAKSQ